MASWITVLSWHTVFTKTLIYYKFTFVWYSAKQCTTHRPMSHLVHCAVSLAARRTQTAQQLGWFRWPACVMATSAEAGCFCCSSPPPPPQNSPLTLLGFAPDCKAMSATRISLVASSSSFIYFFLAIAWDSQSSALFRLLCMTRHSFRNVIPVDMNVFYSDSKTDLQLRCDCCIKIPAIRGYPSRRYYIDGCMLHVTTPQPLQITPALQEACLWALL